MQRKHFLKIIAMLPIAGGVHNLHALSNATSGLPDTEPMPVLFVGHGNPMNAIEDNQFSRTMRQMGEKLPHPAAILVVSAHWETRGTFVTAMEQPKTIHDFGGFPDALFAAQYPAPGSPLLAAETQKVITSTTVKSDFEWGLDHGTWSVTKNMFPQADIPVIQLSLDFTQGPQYHYELGKQLAALRRKGVLIISSGNMVHNFRELKFGPDGLNSLFGHPWALEANETFKKQILENDFKSLINYKTFSHATQLAAPTPDHYLPLLYSVALRDTKDSVSFFNDAAVAGSLTMTSVLISRN
jgi:4,5-DOPA dioxygenase extradiol